MSDKMSDDEIRRLFADMKEDNAELKQAMRNENSELKQAMRDYLLRAEWVAAFYPVKSAVYLLISVVLIGVTISVLLLVFK